jgi:hypothetical protein
LQDASGESLMRNSLLTRAALAAVAGWGVWAGLAHAQGPWPKTPPAATELPPGYAPVDSTPSSTPLRDWFHFKRPLCCWASFNGYGCGSLHSELAFLFGSCRTFFSEPCLKGPPPSALPPWAGPESGYWQPPPGQHTPYAGQYPIGAPARPIPATPIKQADCKGCP